MAEKRQPFRFRLPWLAPQRPATQPPRPRGPSQSTTSIPINRPAFRPGGKAPASPSPQQSPPTIDPPKTSPPTTTAKPPPPPPPPQSSAVPTKTTPQSTPPSSSPTTSKPPSSVANDSLKPNSQSTSSPKSTIPSTSSPPRPTAESPKSAAPSTSSPPSSTTTKPPAPAFVTIESPKTNPQSTSSSKPVATAKPPSPPRSANESVKTAPQNAPTQPSPEEPTVAKPPPRVGSQPASSSQGKPQSMVPSVASSPSSQGKPQSTVPSVASSPSSQGKPQSTVPSVASSPSSQGKPQSMVPSVASSQGKPQSTVPSVASSPSKGDSKSKTSPFSPASSRATSQAQQESAKVSKPQSPSHMTPQKETTAQISTPTHEATQKELKTTVSNVSQSISSPAKPQNQGSSEPPTSTESKPSAAQEDTTSVATEKSASQDNAIAGEQTEGSRLTKGASSAEITVEPAPPQKPVEEKKNKATPGLGNNKMQETPEIKETLSTTSYIGKQIKTTGPSQPIRGNTSTSFQKSVEDGTPRHAEIKEDISKLVRNLTTGRQFDEKQVLIITLTGENKGASMLMSSEETKREARIHIHRGYKTDPDESLEESATDGETGTNRKRLNDKPAPAATAYVNNNVQSVNNSIIIEASVAGRNPGVHLLLSQNTSEAVKADGKSKSIEARKAEFTSTRSERLTHEPTVRRRCLRGLFLESSDSEPENPDKPRRHGCRYSCGGKDKEFM